MVHVASYVNTALTGHGQVAFAGGSYVTPTGIYLELVTPGPFVRLDGFTPVERVHQAGWIGVGFSAGGGYHESITWMDWLDVWTRAWGFSGNQINGDQFWWDCTTGTTLRVEITY